MVQFLAEWLTPQGVIAVGVVWTTFQAWRNQRVIKELEKNTNSIKDALIVATAKASDLEGEKRGRDEQIAKQEAAKP